MPRRIDFLAPKAGQNDWFHKLLSSLDAAYPNMRINNYPGLWFAKALVARNEEEEAKEVRSAFFVLKRPMHSHGSFADRSPPV
jgi:hypothetical protein